ncbi:MAG TPA: transcriptional regulator [Nitrososphaera sp.]|jgi:predicted transcriptional regulator|nr:transcriptional regulator [Thermoproteota archaeon]HEU0144231.1 transcriptional regulator [Nitrososphaera sp.]
MLLPSEIEAKSLIPAVRAILAKKLIREYSLKEEDVAKDLGITQAAVSNYVRGTRGDTELISKLESVREVMRMIDDIAKDLSTNKAYTPSTLAKFVGLCNYMRYTLIICDVHHSIESNIDEQICEQCRGTLVREH